MKISGYLGQRWRLTRKGEKGIFEIMKVFFVLNVVEGVPGWLGQLSVCFELRS